MKKDIHPKYNEITVVLSDGKTSFKTRSTYGADTLQLDIDTANHPAWNQGKANMINEKAGKVASFNDKFGGFDFMGGGAKKEEK